MRAHTSDRGVILIAARTLWFALTSLDNADTELLTAAEREAAGQPLPIGSFVID